MVMRKKLTVYNNQQGMVSILVTMLLMIIITLIVVGFAKLAQREQRQVLDKQLETQAFYAAETGINDAIKIISSGNFVPKTDCGASGPYGDGIIDAAANVSYSCLLVDLTPGGLEFDTVSTAQSTVFQMRSSTVAPFDTVTFNWRPTASASGGTDVSGCTQGQFPQNANYDAGGTCDIGILRIDLLPTEGAAFTRSGLTNNMATIFAVPDGSGAGTVTYGGSTGFTNQGVIVRGSCNASGCSATMSGLNARSYAVRLRGVYIDSAVTITATSSGGVNLPIAGAQAVVDSTGKATDVLRRLQVRVPLNSLGNIPDFAIQSKDTLCKRLVVAATVVVNTTDSDSPVDVATCSL